MCILFFALKQHPKYPVIICANRDEFHQRPTKAMHWWPKSSTFSQVLAGKDLQANGTWLGLTTQGKFSALTNFRQPQHIDKTKQSRGDLVLHALAKTDDQIASYLQRNSARYNGFNLVYGTLTNLSCFDSVAKQVQPLNTGFHSICNGGLDDIWPKMALGEAKLRAAITNANDDHIDIDALFELMKNTQQAPQKLLPNTGIAEHLELLLSSIFIISPEYGTRTTTIITQDTEGLITVVDKSFNVLGECMAEKAFAIEAVNNPH